jgi:hypothetical protein
MSFALGFGATRRDFWLGTSADVRHRVRC